MGLCALRTSDDARVAAAVTWTLEHPARLRLFWAANEGGQGGDGTEGPDSRHSAALPSLPWYDRPERSDPANFRA
ncbi:hypothetical protein DEH18_27540 [Streptomyces sp. NHF165]|nr:hypothetical protein DEH18_27540 [Streptomyces sp. NHF165]